MRDSKQILAALSDAIANMDEEAAPQLTREALAVGVAAPEILSDGIIKGMDIASDKYENGEYFVPELLLCSDALYAGLHVLRPYLKQSSSANRGRVVIGVVEGDTHDIGKNIVKVMLEGAGFEVMDLGRNVPYATFIEAAVEFRADIIGLSVLMTTAMDGMDMVIKNLARMGLRDRFKVIVGGAPVSLAFAKKIGADGYAPNAPGAVRLVKSLASPQMQTG